MISITNSSTSDRCRSDFIPRVSTYSAVQISGATSDQRDALRAHLDASGVKTIIQWGGKTIHQFRNLKLNNDVSATEALTHRFFLLPMNTSLSNEDVAYVCEQVLRFHR